MQKNHIPPPKGMVGPRAVHLSKLLRCAFNRICNEQGLFSGQQDILFQVNENEGITVGELSKKINSSKATISTSIKRMEKNGFVIKKPDEADARVIRLYPTDKARELPEIIKSNMDALESTLIKDMTDDEVMQLSNLLDLAIKNIEQRGDRDA